MRCAWTLAIAILLQACGNLNPYGATLRVRVAGGMGIQAAAKVAADIDTLHVRLLRASDATLVKSHQTNGSTSVALYFDHVPDGTYYLTAEAFDGTGASITQGGFQTSGNTATVSNMSVSYSDNGTELAVQLRLLDETTAEPQLTFTVNPGQPWTGEPVGMP